MPNTFAVLLLVALFPVLSLANQLCNASFIETESADVAIAEIANLTRELQKTNDPIQRKLVQTQIDRKSKELLEIHISLTGEELTKRIRLRVQTPELPSQSKKIELETRAQEKEHYANVDLEVVGENKELMPSHALALKLASAKGIKEPLHFLENSSEFDLVEFPSSLFKRKSLYIIDKTKLPFNIFSVPAPMFEKGRYTLSPNGRFLTYLTSKSILQWDLAKTQNIVKETAFRNIQGDLPLVGQLSALRLSPTGNVLVATDSITKETRVFDIQSGKTFKLDLVLHPQDSHFVASFKPNSNDFVIAYRDIHVLVSFDARGEMIQKYQYLKSGDYPLHIKWAPQGDKYALIIGRLSAVGTLQIYDANGLMINHQDSKEINTYQGSADSVWSHNGNHFFYLMNNQINSKIMAFTQHSLSHSIFSIENISGRNLKFDASNRLFLLGYKFLGVQAKPENPMTVELKIKDTSNSNVE